MVDEEEREKASPDRSASELADMPYVVELLDAEGSTERVIAYAATHALAVALQAAASREFDGREVALRRRDSSQ